MGVYGETIDIDSPTFRRLTSDAEILTQAVRMRLQTSPGTYFDDPEYGFDLQGLTMEGISDEQLAALSARIAAEIEKDERVQSASVKLTATTSGSSTSVTFAADVTPLDGDSFSLTIGVPDLSVELLLRGT